MLTGRRGEFPARGDQGVEARKQEQTGGAGMWCVGRRIGGGGEDGGGGASVMM